MKSIKAIVTVLCGLAVSPLIVLVYLERLIASERLFVSASQLLALIPNIPGQYVRAAFYAVVLKNCSWEVHIGFGTVFSHRAVCLGRHVSLGNYCVIGHAEIEEGAMIGSRVSIPSGKNQHVNELGQLTRESNTFSRVLVGAGCWIGEGAILLANVGKETLIAAGGVVVDPIPAHVIAAGNPARVIKSLESC